MLYVFFFFFFFFVVCLCVGLLACFKFKGRKYSRTLCSVHSLCNHYRTMRRRSRRKSRRRRRRKRRRRRSLSVPSQLSPQGAYNKQSNKKTQSSRHQKLTRSTHKCLTNITLPPPLHTHINTLTHTHTHTHTHTRARAHTHTHTHILLYPCEE